MSQYPNQAEMQVAYQSHVTQLEAELAAARAEIHEARTDPLYWSRFNTVSANGIEAQLADARAEIAMLKEVGLNNLANGKVEEEILDDAIANQVEIGKLRAEIERLSRIDHPWAKDAHAWSLLVEHREVEIKRLTKRCEEARETIEHLCNQFAYRFEGPALGTGGLSALEDGFEFLGWTDPHLVPELGCDEPGCKTVSTCGWPSESGYRRTCGKHMRMQLEGKP